jgi:hypothetical protein
MVHKHFIKNTVIFTAMLLIVGVNSAPIMSKAGNDFGVAFSVDGETKFTGRQNKYTSSSVQMSCTDKDIDGSYYYGKVYAIDGEKLTTLSDIFSNSIVITTKRLLRAVSSRILSC